jgi:hypothetical protein
MEMNFRKPRGVFLEQVDLTPPPPILHRYLRLIFSKNNWTLFFKISGGKESKGHMEKSINQRHVSPTDPIKTVPYL